MTGIPATVLQTLNRWKRKGISYPALYQALTRVYSQNGDALPVGSDDSGQRLNVRLLQLAIFQALNRNGSLTAIELQRLSKALNECVRVLQALRDNGHQSETTKNAVNEALQVMGLHSHGPDQPGTDQPGTAQPGTDQPETAQPGTDQPGTDQPADKKTWDKKA